MRDYDGVNWNGALQGEVDGLPVGMTVPEALPFDFGGAGGCGFGACGGSGFDGDPGQQIQSLWDNILEHLGKLSTEPGAESANHWWSEIGGWAGAILRKAQKVTLKRRPGALDEYLKLLGVDPDVLRGLIPSPVITVNPCIIERSFPGCNGPGGTPIA